MKCVASQASHHDALVIRSELLVLGPIDDVISQIELAFQALDYMMR